MLFVKGPLKTRIVTKIFLQMEKHFIRYTVETFTLDACQIKNMVYKN
jgi:hypothetical protein